ncbi:fatty acid desaturase [Caldithrix abyssi DSM 13497]|uniref:Fatty acid desaturase n=1 Tax=Caldithrix abyssi DSM 13497 TaxID=880073 RepID=H1XVL8_CALAY|nr:fatty acid desaturase [Caldithrix abyssi]APF18961.1 omega-6 fatty acid desaturase (delta-12 desaturase) [Caldithrix abyssi DSM 13497]EHO42918.1 fatty acid desaturase [Caldithrix abyssi DSM 13497]
MKNTLTLKQINQQLAPFAQPSTKKSLWELFVTLTSYLGLWTLMVYLLKQNVSYVYILPLTVLGGLFMVRTFIIFHDACHGSFCKTRTANKWIGRITGLLTFTPFEEWRQAHNMHHASSGDLDRRGVGDVWTMTVDEYKQASKLKRLAYRLYRHPLVMFGLGPFFLFLVSNRLPGKDSKKEARRGVWLTNLAAVIMVTGISLLIGFKTYLMIQIPVMFVGGLAGIWLFYVQHQFENTYWSHNDEWNVVEASIKGSSYYQLPAILHWFSGNIGYHHIHHLRSGIPFYNLPACQKQIDLFREVEPLTISKSLKSVKLHLWDERQKKLIGFKDLKAA